MSFLILVRHGQSLWNLEKRFTGWVDIDLTKNGKLEAEKYLRRPRSVRIDSDFRLFIPDFESYRIQVYQKDFIELDETQFAEPLRNPTLEVT